MSLEPYMDDRCTRFDSPNKCDIDECTNETVHNLDICSECFKERLAERPEAYD